MPDIKVNTTNSLTMAWVRTYASLVVVGRRTIEQVPESYRSEVQNYIASQK